MEQIDENILNSKLLTETYLSKKTNKKYTKSILLSDNGSVVQNIWTDENGLGIDTSKWESEENCGKKIIMT